MDEDDPEGICQALHIISSVPGGSAHVRAGRTVEHGGIRFHHVGEESDKDQRPR